MKILNPVLFCCFLLNAFPGFSQLVINEVDSDTPGFDDQEFIELRSDTAFFPLDGYVLVLFNGSENGMDSSYFHADLSGFSTDINGIFLISSKQLSPAPQYFIAPNVIQNGADAIAVYKTNATLFEEPVPATTTNLIDALAYDTNDADDERLLELLGLSQQINENENDEKQTQSVQRNEDGTYRVKTPTPRRPNNGGGVEQIGINFSLNAEEYEEGAAIKIEFNIEKPVVEDRTFSIKLTNFGFNEADFTGKTQLNIPAGTTTLTTTIHLINDDLDEGDEEMLLRFDKLPSTFIPLRDRAVIRIVDDDYTTAPWGTPLDPTYDLVEKTTPPEYYVSLNGKSGVALQEAITRLIANPEVVRAQTYADVIDILKEADENPKNSNEVWMLYTEKSRAKLDFQLTSDSFNKWNREHVFPRSRGGFYSIESDAVADGPDVFIKTSVDSIRHGNTDAHALRVVDARENSSRNNQNYGEYAGPSGTAGSFYGDVARSSFFIALRYAGLEVVNGFPDSGKGKLGDLQTLLRWHRTDLPDDFERHRNNVVYTWQKNRNPFIDYPELVEYIWGNKQDEVWNANLSIADQVFNLVKLYPNPAEKSVVLEGFSGEKELKIFNLKGKLMLKKSINSGQRIPFNFPPGIYFLELGSNKNQVTKKLIVQ